MDDFEGVFEKKICRFVGAKCHIKLIYAIYIKCFVSQSVCHVLFVPGGQQIVCSLEEKHFSHIGEGGGKHFRPTGRGQTNLHQGGGQTILQQGMGTNIFTSTRKGANNFTSKGGQTFLHLRGGGTNIFTLRGGDKHFYIDCPVLVFPSQASLDRPDFSLTVKCHSGRFITPSTFQHLSQLLR